MGREKQVYISELSKYEDSTVTMRGWLDKRRSSGKLQFLIFRDGSGYMQAVVSKADVAERVWNETNTNFQNRENASSSTITKCEYIGGTTFSTDTCF